MQIEPFGVEIWMNEWETRCGLNLAETCVHSISVGELLALAGRNDGDLSELLPLRMTYGEIEGSERLRRAVAALYEQQKPENVVITHGTIGANMLVHKSLVERGDRVVAVVPSYQQHYSIPESIGAEVEKLWLREEDGWLPDLERLREMVAGGAKLIALTNPNNPTGALMDRDMLEEVAAIARQVGAWVLADEVYRGTDQEGAGATVSMADIYERGISTGGMSKAFSLAGLRLGWVVAPEEVLRAVSIHRDYDTISVGRIDDHLAALALEARDAVLGRARTIVRENAEIVSGWVAGEPLVDWVRPRSGTVAMLRYGLQMGSREFCVALLEETGVMFTPGAALGMEGYVRIGYAQPKDVLREGLGRVSGFLAARA